MTVGSHYNPSSCPTIVMFVPLGICAAVQLLIALFLVIRDDCWQYFQVLSTHPSYGFITVDPFVYIIYESVSAESLVGSLWLEMHLCFLHACILLAVAKAFAM